MMGFYSVLLGIGQLSGGWIGGFFAEAWAVDGLILLSFILSFLAGSGILLTKAAGNLSPCLLTETTPRSPNRTVEPGDLPGLS